jgi:hypothetical protein
MKYIIVIFLFFIGFIGIQSFQSKEIPQKIRYFFVGYAAQGGKVGGVCVWTDDGKFLSFNKSVRLIKDYLQIDSTGKIVITSVYEFKNKEDFKRFHP